MALNFPDTPTLNQTFTVGYQTWKWDGTAWNLEASPGPAGASVISGLGAPSNSVGSDGDHYINLTNGDFYGPKASGVWPLTPAFTLGSGVTYRYVHNQAIASDTWTITHNLATKPNVVVVDSAGTWLLGDVTYISDLQVILSFSSPFSGFAYLT